MYELIQTKESFNKLLSRLENTDIFAYDSETNGTFDRFKVEVVGLSFAWREDEITAVYLPISHLEGEQVPIDYVLDGLTPLFESKKHEKICHNTKFDEMVLSRYGIEVQGFAHCTFVMAWMLAEDSSSKGLKQLVLRNYGVEMSTYEDTIQAAPKKRGVDRNFSFAPVRLEDAKEYGAADSYWAYRLFEDFKPELIEQGLWDAYVHIEAPFVRVLRHMEARGVCIDLDNINRADKRLPKIIEEVEASIYEQAGEVFNIGSGQQLGHILFEKLGVGEHVKTTKTGNYSTDKKTLALYASKHQIVRDILRRKKIVKTHSTFVEGLKKFIAEDGKLHASFNGNGTVTGRLNSRSPNLQNIEGDEVEEVKIRSFFVPSPGYRFLVADFGQVELRIMAHCANDTEMINAFLTGRDFHEETARRMFNLSEELEVSPRQRFYAKAINFGIGYGRGPFSIAEQVGCSQEEAQAYIDDWKRSFPTVTRYIDYVVKQTRERGYVRTLSGRKRRLLPEIRSNNWAVRTHAERQAFNSRIQGSAADIIKMAMIALEPALEDLGGFICIQIHDELVIEIPDDRAEEGLQTVQRIMENPHNGSNPLRLPLVVDPKIVDNWSEGK